MLYCIGYLTILVIFISNVLSVMLYLIFIQLVFVLITVLVMCCFVLVIGQH